MKDDLVVVLNEFHANAKIAKYINSTFISLIPKVDGASSFSEFRHISMVNNVYQFLSKVVANRLKLVLPSIIGESQATFIGGKQVLYGVLLASEVIHFWKHNNAGGTLKA